MVHVLNQDDMMVQLTFVFISTCHAGRNSSTAHLGHRLKSVEHCPADAFVIAVDSLTNVESLCVEKLSFDSIQEDGEDLDERDDSFPLLDREFSLLDASDLFCDELLELRNQTHVKL